MNYLGAVKTIRQIQKVLDRKDLYDEDVVPLVEGIMESRKDERYVCVWRYEDGEWYTGCGYTFPFTMDSPDERGMKYCPYCGARLVPMERAQAILDFLQDDES